MAKQTGLGKGFGALIPQDFDAGLLAAPGERVEQLDVTLVAPNPEQPRTVFDDTALNGLADSIRQYGILQPLIVTADGKNYMIIAGERRFRAAGLAGLKRVPVIVRTAKQQEQLELAILENVQRVDLSPLEEAVSVERLHQQFNLTYDTIAKRLGKSNSAVANTVRLLQLPEFARTALAEHKISEGHARQVLALKDNPDQQNTLVELIIQNGWSVRQAERYVSSLKAGVKERAKADERVSGDTPETERLSKRFGTAVRVHRTAKGGRVEITFTSDEQLAKLLSELEN